MTAAALAAGLAIGLSLGVFGGGGSILTVPVFVYLLGMDAKVAIATSLAVVGATSLVGVLGHWRAGRVDLRLAGTFGAFAMAGSYAGARSAALVSGGVQLLLFAFVMVLAAFFMLRPPRLPVPAGAAAASPRRLPLGWIAVEGVAVGALTGLVGVGGGFLIVPALVLLGGVPMKHAVGTSLLVIALKSAAGVAGYAGQVPIDAAFALVFTGVAAAGILAGSWLLRYVPAAGLQRAFAVFLLVMGGFILYENRGTLLPSASPAVEAAPAGEAGARTEGGRDAAANVL